MMKKPEEFSVKQLLELFDNGSINVEQLNHLVRELRSAAHEQEPVCVSHFFGSVCHTTWNITPPTTGTLTLYAEPVLLEKGPLQSPRATTATNVLLKSFEEAVDEAELSDSGVMISTGRARQLLDLARAGVRPQPCEHFCEARAFEIEIRQLTARAEAAEAQLKAAQEQKPFRWFLADRVNQSEDMLSEVTGDIDPDREVLMPMYLAPVPTPTVPELDNVEGNILPPIGASVAIHLASSDTWVDHTVVGYYVWGPLGGISDSYSRVFVRVVDGQGVLNARLLKDVKWDRNAAVRALQPPRPAEPAVAVPDEDDYAAKYMDLLSDVLDAKEVMRDAGVKHNVFSIMFTEYSKLISPPRITEQSAVAVPDGWRLVPQMLTTKMYDAIVRCADDRRFASWPANIWENACDAAPDAPAPHNTEPTVPVPDKNTLELEFLSIMAKINSVNFKFVDGEPEPELGSGRSVPVILGVAWKVFKAARNTQSTRITEQELREIAGSVLGQLQLATTANIDQWFEREGRFIQGKLNGARQCQK